MKSWLKYVLMYLCSVLAISIILEVVYGFGVLKGLRALFGITYVLFLPGFVVVRLFFWDIDWVEKLGLSLALSIALVILSVIFTNLIFNIPITALTNFFVILGVIVLTFLVKKYEEQIVIFFKKMKSVVPNFLGGRK